MEMHTMAHGVVKHCLALAPRPKGGASGSVVSEFHSCLNSSSACSGIKLRLSSTICNEYASRNVFTGEDDWPEVDWDAPDAFTKGVTVNVSEDAARSILADAEFNSNARSVDVGTYGMPLGVFNAYRALAKQARLSLAGTKS